MRYRTPFATQAKSHDRTANRVWYYPCDSVRRLMDRMYLLEIDFQLRSEKRREFNSSLDSLLGGVGSGHARALAYEDRDDGNHLLLVFEWSQRGEVEAYLESRPFGALLGCLKTLGEVADCRIVDLSGSELAAGGRAVARWVGGRQAPKQSHDEKPSRPD